MLLTSVSRGPSVMSFVSSNQNLNIKDSRPNTSLSAAKRYKYSNFSSCNTPIDRPKSVPTRLFGAQNRNANFNRCIRVKIANNPNSLEPTFPTKKEKSEPWQKSYDGEIETLVQTPTYLLMKNNQTYNAIVKGEFFDPWEEETTAIKSDKNNESSKKLNLPPALQEYINKLLQQIDELELFLEEERFSHRNTKTQAQEHLKDQLKAQMNKYENLLNILKEEYTKDKENIKNKYTKQMNDDKLKYELGEQKLKAELQLLSGSFQTYKTNLDLEYKRMFEIKEEEIAKRCEQEAQEKMENAINKLHNDRAKEKKDFLRQQKAEIELLRKQTQDEINTEKKSEKTSSSVTLSKNKIEDLNSEIEDLKEELKLLKETNEKSFKKLRHTENQLLEKTNIYNELKLNFDSKLKNIEEKYKEQIDNLVNEMSGLRMLYLKKCDELYDERQLTTGKIVEKAKITRDYLKKKIIETRKNLKVSMAAYNPELSTEIPKEKTRRSSFPTTRDEKLDAINSAGNMDNAITLAKRKFTNITPRPHLHDDNQDENLTNNENKSVNK